MDRYGWKAKVRPGMLEEYKKRHDNIWPEMTKMLNDAGIRNYTIWNVGDDLFGYYECDSMDFASRVQAESEINKKWDQFMKDVMIAEKDPVTGAQPLMKCVFRHGCEEKDMAELGYKHYMFVDGDLPGNGDDMSLPGHEALMITNRNKVDAHISVTFYFSDKEPKKGIKLVIPAERVMCYRLDLPFGEEGYKLPFGQYSLELDSDIPVCASFGRLDRRFNLGYYTTGSVSC